VEGYLAIGMTDEAQRIAAILGYNFPGSPWYQRTYALMQQRNVQQVNTEEARRRGWLGRTFGAVF
jgi:outer membrane protein assembly factor BamD